MMNISVILEFSFRTKDTTMFWIMVLNTRISTLILFSKCSYFAKVYIVTPWISTIAFEFLLHGFRVHIQFHSLSEEKHESAASSYTFLLITETWECQAPLTCKRHTLKFSLQDEFFSWESCFATPAIKIIITWFWLFLNLRPFSCFSLPIAG